MNQQQRDEGRERREGNSGADGSRGERSPAGDASHGDEPRREIPSPDAGTLALLEEKERLEAQLQRSLADLQNIRKRHLREMDEARLRAMEAIAQELLPILDNFQRALSAHEHTDDPVRAREQTESMLSGLRMVHSLLEGVLERHGIAEIPAAGEVFDPNVHEAVGIDPRAGLEPGRVSQVLQRGYRLGDRVIRPSKVLVASDSGAGPSGGGPSGGSASAEGKGPSGGTRRGSSGGDPAADA